uniref:Phospholipase A2 n=1 Tax=Crocodylus porosus TaxID=8502 RepID=A0A7M4FQY0_CROPO
MWYIDILLFTLSFSYTVTQSDCYVTLYLPTASVHKVRTKTVNNTKDPLWNETFHFRIQSQVKNILELKVCDEDSLTQDDHLLTVFFDVSKIQLGETVRLNFQLNPKHLCYEYQSPVFIWLCKDVMVTIRFCVCLVTTSDRKFAFMLEGSYEGAQNLSLNSWLFPATPARFHYIKYNHSDLNVTIPQRRQLSRVRHYWTEGLCRRPKNLDVRLGFDLCPEEQNFLKNRKQVVAAGIKKVLHLDEDLQDYEIPVVAVTTTGVGIRALTGMYGSIWGLQKLNLLDCISYITGSSGTTWTMTKLYEDADWSQKDLGEIISEARKQATKCKRNAFSLQNLKNYYRELSERTAAGHKTSFIDLWGLMIEAMLQDGKDHHRLSDQKKAVNLGQNPLPIYLALNVKDKITTKEFREWVEFTPYEVGFLKYGAFIRAEDFGSEFYMGRLMKRIPESRICFMQGMWSSIFSKNLLDAWHAADNSEDFWHRWTQATVTEIGKSCFILSFIAFDFYFGLSNALRDVLTDRPAVSKYHSFLRGFQMHNEYTQNEHFCKWKDTQLDSSPNQLRDTAEHLEMADTAFFYDTSCPPLMKPERKVDVILHLNYSGGSQPLEHASRYFSEQGIPFPKTVLNEEEKTNLKECYIFEDEATPGAPIVLYFPLVNDSFQRFIAPGVPRSVSEMEMGKVDVSGFLSPYATREVTLKAEDFNKLLKLTNYNILNNENLILQALRTAVARKRQTQSQLPSAEQLSS